MANKKTRPVASLETRIRVVTSIEDLNFWESIGGLTPVVQVWDAYCGSRRFSVVWCETSRYRLKVYHSTLVVHIFTFSIKRWTP